MTAQDLAKQDLQCIRKRALDAFTAHTDAAIAPYDENGAKISMSSLGTNIKALAETVMNANRTLMDIENQERTASASRASSDGNTAKSPAILSGEDAIAADSISAMVENLIQINQESEEPDAPERSPETA